MSARDVTLNLGTRLAPGGDRGFGALAAAASEASKREEEYQRRLHGTIATLKERERFVKDLKALGYGPGIRGGLFDRATGGHAGNIAQGFGAGGMAGVAGATLAGYTALTAALGKVAQGMETLGNSTLTTAQKSDALAKQFIPGAEKLIAFRDALTGVTDAIRKTELWFAGQSLKQAQTLERYQSLRPLRVEAASQRRRAAAYTGGVAFKGERPFEGLTITPVARGDRSTFQGDIAHREAVSLAPLRDASARADAEAKAARQTANASETHYNQLVTNRGKLQEGMKKARAKEKQTVEDEDLPVLMGGGRNKAGRHTAGREALLAEEAVLNNEVGIQAEITRQKELGVTAAQKESAARKANIAVMQQELALAQQKEQRLTSQAQRLGSMSVMDRQMGLAAARMVKGAKGDLTKVAPEILARARAFAPEFVAKESEKFGERTAEHKAGIAEGFLEKGAIKEAREKVAALHTAVRVNVNLDESLLAKEIAAVLERSIGQLVKSLEAKFKAQAEKLRTGNQIRHNAS